MKFVAPTISDKAEIAKAVSPYVMAGAATPNMLIDALGDLLGKSFEPFEGEWADKPMQLLLKEMEIEKENESKEPEGETEGEEGVNTPESPENGLESIEKADSINSIVCILKSLQSMIEEVLADAV